MALSTMRLNLLVLFRCINAIILCTSFNPDEYWQSLEVAHRAVFGYGVLTWEWLAGLRSYAHVLLFMAPFKLLQALGWDSRAAVLYTPKLLQGVIAALTDVVVARLSNRLFGPAVTRFTMACQLLSWFNLFCLPRTYSNNLEALLVVYAIYRWPSLHKEVSGKKTAGRDRLHCLAMAALCVILRPSSVMFWLVICFRELWVCRDRARFVFLESLPVAATAILASLAVDRVGYGRWVFVPWEFFKFNVLEGGSAQYGVHPWHWNFSQGFPVVMGPLLPLLLHAVVSCPRRGVLLLALLVLALYSLPAHKEFRFLLPAHLLCIPYCGWSLAQLLLPPSARDGKLKVGRSVTGASRHGAAPQKGGRGCVSFAAVLLLLFNIPLALYFMLLHQRGIIAIMDHLAAISSQRPDLRVLMLMPCHTTPFYSHVHHNISMRFLDCSPKGQADLVFQASPPNVITSGQDDKSATALFMEDPRAFVDTYFPAQTFGLEFDYVVTLDEFAKGLGGWLQHCRLKHQFFNAHFTNHHELQRYVLAYDCSKSGH